MVETKHIRIEDYDYALPDERIAKFPLAERDSSKLLVYEQGKISEDIFSNLPSHLPDGSLLVFNNTRVIQARMHFRKPTGALIEVFCLEPYAPADYEQNFQQRQSCEWICMIGNSKKWKDGELCRNIDVCGRQLSMHAERKGEAYGNAIIRFVWDDAGVCFSEILERAGELPIPPYLNRPSEESDKRTYQTVYSKVKGSVAAPTAGLHFTDQVLNRLKAQGIECGELTLHVGAGTFKPVKSDEIEGHEMHTEYFAVTRTLIERILAHDAKVIAVGTTSVRTLESLYYLGVRLRENPDISMEKLHVEQWEPYAETATLTAEEALRAILCYMDTHDLDSLHASTQIIIAPGYHYHFVRAMITNFHQPKSTLLLLVSAFVGEDWKRIYDYALSHDFRFLSYGDSSLLIP